MPREQQRYRERRYKERQCQHCTALFTPRSGNTRNCDQCGDLRHRSALLPVVRVVRQAKPLIGATAPDFLRELPALKAELERQAPAGARLMPRYFNADDPAEIGHGGRSRNA